MKPIKHIFQDWLLNGRIGKWISAQQTLASRRYHKARVANNRPGKNYFTEENHLNALNIPTKRALRMADFKPIYLDDPTPGHKE